MLVCCTMSTLLTHEPDQNLSNPMLVAQPHVCRTLDMLEHAPSPEPPTNSLLQDVTRLGRAHVILRKGRGPPGWYPHRFVRCTISTRLTGGTPKLLFSFSRPCSCSGRRKGGGKGNR
jgi:hypothetical protein